MLNHVMTGINPKISLLAWTMNLKLADLPDHLDLILYSGPPDSWSSTYYIALSSIYMNLKMLQKHLKHIKRFEI